MADLIGLVWEEDLVEDLSGFVLNGVHLHQVRGVAPCTRAEREREITLQEVGY